jgi:hypothetical protein
MKKMFTIITIVASFAACKNGTTSEPGNNKAILTNTSSTDKTSAPSDTRSNTSTSTGTGTTTTTTQNTTHKKGWSSRAKGAVIGGAAGAVGGAIVSKHKGTGAVVGGVVGAAGGYIIGNEKDKKNNR